VDTIIITRDYRQAVMAFAGKLNVSASDLDMANITPYDIELHTPLSNTSNTYSLDFKDGGGKSWEKRLKSGELFFAYGIGIFVTKYDPAAMSQNRPYFSYPDPNFFATAGESAALELIWNGDVDLITNSVNRIMGFKAHHFRTVPKGNYTGTPGTPTALNEWGPSFEQRGFYLPALYPLFDGDETNTIKLTLGVGSQTGVAGGAGVLQNQLIFKLTGFKYSGGLPNPGSCNV